MVVVSFLLVIVAVAVAGGVTDDGLTVQTGASVTVCVAVTAHPRFTAPAKPFTEPIVKEIEELPPGTIICGLGVAAHRVNSVVPCVHCALAIVAETSTTSKQNAGAAPSRCQSFNLDSDPSGFNMSRLSFSGFDTFDSSDR